MKKWIIGAVVLALLVGAVLGTMGNPVSTLAQPKPTPEPRVPAVKATDDVIAEAVVVPVYSTGLATANAGIVQEVMVAEGDRVEAGQALVKLDATHLANAVLEAEANLATSEAQLARARKGASEGEIAAARAAVSAAEASLADLMAGPTATEREQANLAVAEAEGVLKLAQVDLQELRRGPSAVDKRMAELAISEAKNALWGAQGSRDSLFGNKYAPGGAKTQAQAQVASAELAVTVAQLSQEKLLKGPEATSVAAAHVRVGQAELAVQAAELSRDRQLEGASSGAIAAAQSQLAQARATLARLLDGPAAEDIAVAEAQLAQAKAAVARASAALEESVLRAPVAGSVVSLDVKVGEYIAPGQIVVRIADLGAWRIETTDLTELAVVKVREGAPATVTVDALPGAQFRGQVQRIKALGENNRGDITYKVIVVPESQPDGLRWNMTAKVTISTN